MRSSQCATWAEDGSHARRTAFIGWAAKRFLFVVVLLLVIVTFLIGFYGLWLIWDDEYPV